MEIRNTLHRGIIVFILFNLNILPAYSNGISYEQEIRAQEFANKIVPNQLIVKFKPYEKRLSANGASAALDNKKDLRKNRIDHLIQKHKIRKTRRAFSVPSPVAGGQYASAQAQQLVSDYEGTWVFELSENENIHVTKKSLESDSDIEYVEFNHYFTADFEVNDPFYFSFGSWDTDVDDLWGLKSMYLVDAWPLSTGEDIVVAVIDSGIDYMHEDIGGQIWKNPNEICCNGIDDDGNGYIDDITGWDFVENDADPMDLNGHGTHVSGTIAAVGGNQIGIMGVAPGSKILPLRALNEYGSGSTEWLAAALRYAADNGAHIINNSWSGLKSQTIDDAVRYAQSKGAIVVASAGNRSEILEDNYSPSSVEDVVVVGAIDASSEKADFSNYGPLVDIMGPGRDILSLHASTAEPNRWVLDEHYSVLYGTSMSAPHISGLIAQLLNQNPELNARQVKMLLQRTATDLLEGGWDLNTSYGNANAFEALSDTNDLPDIQLKINAPTNLSMFGAQEIPIAISTSGLDLGHWRLESAFINGNTPQSFTEITSGYGDIYIQEVASISFDDNDQEGHYLIRLSADYENETYFSHSLVQFDPTIKANFPKRVAVTRPNDMSIFSRLTSTFIDIDNNGDQEMVSLEDWQITIRDESGNPELGSPFDLPYMLSTAPAFADLDNDGDQEIIVGLSVPSDVAPIWAFHHDGTVVRGFPSGTPASTNYPELNNFLVHPPIVSDIDNDGDYEIFANVYKHHWFYGSESSLILMDHSGNVLPNWNFIHSHQFERVFDETQFAWIDVNEDQIKELILIDKIGYTSSSIYKDTIEIRDINFNLVNEIEFPLGIPVRDMKVVQFENDAAPKILSGTGDRANFQYHLHELDGTPVTGWPITGYDQHIFADADNNGSLELVTMSESEIIAYDSSGTIVQGYPKSMPEELVPLFMSSSNDFHVQSFRSTLSDAPIMLISGIRDIRSTSRLDILAAIDINGEIIKIWDKQDMFPLSLPAVGLVNNNIEINIINGQRKMFNFILPATGVSQEDSFFTFKADAQRSNIFRMGVNANDAKCSMPELQLRGDFNHWGSLAMTCVKDNTWQATIIADDSNALKFKFDQHGDWKTNYGDNNNDGIADPNGKNISLTQGAGEYKIIFNDVSLSYSAERIDLPPFVDINFLCENCETFWGQNVYVVGNIAELGSWDPAKAIKLGASNYPNWEKSLPLPRHNSIEYKCIKKYGSSVIWESGPNHHLSTLDALETVETTCHL